jgi:branched-chain amino acid transport system ATP-binding protein
MLRLRSIEAGYGKLRVLHGVSLHVNPGEIVTIIGGNGAGKSTLLAAIAGLVTPTAGSITIGTAETAGARPEAIVALGCSLVPEGRQLFPSMSVRENLVLGGWLRRRRPGAERERDLQEAYRVFPRLREREGQLAGTMSGGEQQMLAIARSLMAAPRLIMLDEPSMGLAPLVVRDIMDVIGRLRSEGRTILLVEQNARAALAIADRGYVMETGSVVLEGAARELLDNRDVQRAYLGKEYRSVGE